MIIVHNVTSVLFILPMTHFNTSGIIILLYISTYISNLQKKKIEIFLRKIEIFFYSFVIYGLMSHYPFMRARTNISFRVMGLLTAGFYPDSPLRESGDFNPSSSTPLVVRRRVDP